MARALELFDFFRPVISASEVSTVRIKDHDPVLLAQDPGDLARLFRHPAGDPEQSDLDALRDINREIVRLCRVSHRMAGPP